MAKKKQEDVKQEEEETLLQEIRSRYQAARDHRREWRSEARECYRMYAGDQYTPDEKSLLMEQQRPIVVFNFTGPLVEAVIGQEVNNRQEVRYIPRTKGDALVNEVVTEISRFFADQCDLEDEQSDAFRDAVICGEGWTVTRLSDESNPMYDPIAERVDPLEVLPDPSSQKPNYADMRYCFREKKMDRDEARALFPDWDGTDGGDEWDWEDEDEANRHLMSRDTYSDLPDYLRAVQRSVKVLEYQYRDIETFYLVQNSKTGDIKTLEPDAYDEIRDDVEKSPNLKTIAKNRYVWRRAFVIGNNIVHEDAVCPKACLLEAITGKRDREKGYWFGVVRSCMDPQRWANKWLSQVMHILNSSAKGGWLIEKSATDNIGDFESRAARPGATLIVNDGALQSKMIQPIEVNQYPAGFDKLIEYAKQSFYDVTGINAELLGMADREQPGVLEYQRKQSAVSLLAPLFDSLRHYRKRFGRTWLWMIREYVSDGRMVRITTDKAPPGMMPPMGMQPPQQPGMPGQPPGPPQPPQGDQMYISVIPQIFGDDFQEYDVIVDQAPTAPNLQEATWAVMNTLGPLMKDLIGPDELSIMLDASPLPESVKQKLKELRAQKAANPPPPPPEVMKAQMDMQMAQQKMQMDGQKQQADLQIKQQEMQMEMQLKQAELQFLREKAAIELQTMREKAMLDAHIKMGQAEVQQHTAVAKANAEIQVAEQKANSDMAVNEAQASQQMDITQQQADQQYQQQQAAGKLKYDQMKKMASAKGKKQNGNS